MVHTPAKPVVTVVDGRVSTTSCDVATFFGKSHKGVLRIIDNLLAIKPALGLGPSPYFGEKMLIEANPSGGEAGTRRAFDISRDGFMLLVTRFKGAQTVFRALRYDEAFIQKEEEAFLAFKLPGTDFCPGIDILRRADAVINEHFVREHEKMNEALQMQIAELGLSASLVRSTCSSEDGKTAKQIWDSLGLPRKIRGSSLWLGNQLARFGCLIDSDLEGGASEARLFDPVLAQKILKFGLLETARTYAYERKRRQFIIVCDPD